MLGTSFLNTFTSGEISDDAWDRNDIQPVTKGCQEATNLVLRIAGPLGKRRGFWDNGSVEDPTKLARLIPFRRSVTDALMLEFGDSIVRVWQANGSPLLNGGVQVSFASPYSQAQLAGLRYKQVGDVIYFRHSSGLQPQALERLSDISWAFNVETFPNGPWLSENIDPTLTVTISAAGGGAPVNDASTGSTAEVYPAPNNITLTASKPYFNAGQVGSFFRLRQNNGAPGVKTWSTGYRPPIGAFCSSGGRVYECTTVGTVALVSGVDEQVTTAPVVSSGSQSDGSNIWTFLHDGAGIVVITGFTSSTVVSATIVTTLPLGAQATTCIAECAYSTYRGWPRAWPALIEERLANGATVSNLDMLDLTEIAGFSPTFEDYTPGLGSGQVTDADAIRRRVGVDGGEILWTRTKPFLLIGTASAEHIAAAGLFGEPMTPSTIAIRPLSGFGSADVYPAEVHKGLVYVTRGGQGARKIQLDVQQNMETDDLSFLAQHIAQRQFAQLAWLPYPDEVLWARLGDGGLAALTDHEEQQVRGWTRQQLAGGFICEDIVTLPGPGLLETLWMIVSRVVGGVPQRRIWMQSQPSDNLFIDGAQLYSGAATPTLNGLAAYNGETVRVLANGAQYDLPCAGGSVTLPAGITTTSAQAGLGFQTTFESLTFDLQGLSQALGLRQRLTQMVVKLKTVLAWADSDQGGQMEKILPRQLADIPAPIPRLFRKLVTFAADTERDPSIVITDDSAYDHLIYSIRPKVAVGGN